MKKFRIAVLIALLAIAVPLAIRHRVWALGSPQPGSSTASPGVPAAALEIVSPKPNETLAQTFVTLHYQQLTPAPASSTPTFEIRLDGGDPVQTTDTSYTFNGLTPGNHSAIVRVVDASGTTITRTGSEVKFASSNPAASGSRGDRQAQSLPALPPPQAPNNGDLPSGNSSLPLLSVIGFGILVGGVISALRTRPAHK